jgi:hypothetical protein
MSVQDNTPPAKAGVHFTTLNPISAFTSLQHKH